MSLDESRYIWSDKIWTRQIFSNTDSHGEQVYIQTLFKKLRAFEERRWYNMTLMFHTTYDEEKLAKLEKLIVFRVVVDAEQLSSLWLWSKK